MIRARGYYVMIVSAIALTLVIPVFAQEAVSTPDAPSASAPEVSPQPVMAPSAAPEAAPAANLGKEAQDAARGMTDAKPDAPSASAPEVSPQPVMAPSAAPEAAPAANLGKEAQDAARGMTDAKRESARARRATRSEAKDAEADRHTPKPVHDSSEPDHFRGQIISVNASSIEIETVNGGKMHLGLSENFTVINLTKGSFTTVDFGSYVGSTAVKLEAYSPIVRDSLSWLHKGFELRIVDEQLRGIALGHKKWDLTSDSIIAHGWVDDIEGRVLSIKWGPTEVEETDVEVPRDVPVLKMALGDSSLLTKGARILAGAQKSANGDYSVVYLFISKDGIAPPL